MLAMLISYSPLSGEVVACVDFKRRRTGIGERELFQGALAPP